jgi:hypothetical protein
MLVTASLACPIETATIFWWANLVNVCRKSSQTGSARPEGAGFGLSAVDSRGQTIWIADAHRNDGKRFVVRATDPPHGRGVLPGAKVGNGVAVGEGVAVAAGIGVATCACAPAKKATKPTTTHTLTKAIPERICVLAA